MLFCTNPEAGAQGTTKATERAVRRIWEGKCPALLSTFFLVFPCFLRHARTGLCSPQQQPLFLQKLFRCSVLEACELRPCGIKPPRHHKGIVRWFSLQLRQGASAPLQVEASYYYTDERGTTMLAALIRVSWLVSSMVAATICNDMYGLVLNLHYDPILWVKTDSPLRTPLLRVATPIVNHARFFFLPRTIFFI